MIDGVTRHMLPHLSGVPHLHVNRPLVLLVELIDNKEHAQLYVNRTRCPGLVYELETGNWIKQKRTEKKRITYLKSFCAFLF